MVNGPVAYVQCALLHTSSSGERRIRCASTRLFFGFLLAADVA
jgi:hypothetical protein